MAVKEGPKTPNVPNEAAPADSPSNTQENGPSSMQLKLLKVLLRNTGMENRDLARQYCSQVVGRKLTISKELSRQEISSLIGHLKSLEGWMDGLELSPGIRNLVMSVATASNQAISDQATLQAMVIVVS